jgi:hypothetical protein
MLTILHSVVLGSVLCLSIAGTPAQDKAGQDMPTWLALGDPDAEAIRNHRLTVENVRKMFAVERELIKLMKEVPDLNTRAAELARRFDPDNLTGNVAVEVKVYEGLPEIAQILQRHNISAREYLLTNMVATVTAMIDETRADEAFRSERIDPEFMITPALKFWRARDPALKAEMDEWKKVRAEMTGR